MAQIAVLEFNQATDSEPTHFISKKLASRFVAYFHNGKRVAALITERVIRILIPVDFGKLKGLLKGRERMTVTEKRLFWRQNLLLYYPHKDQGSL